MIALLIVTFLSLATLLPISRMWREPSRAPRVVFDVPDYQFDWRGMV